MVRLANVISYVIKLYSHAGYTYQTALMDGVFEKVQSKLLDKIVVNICSKNKHVPIIECKIQHVKEHCYCIKADIDIPVLPMVIIKHMVIHVVMFLNT